MTIKNLPSCAEMAAFDAATIAGGVSALELMERAGKAMLERAIAAAPDRFKARSKIVILCGPGNNGGDGLVIARLLRAGRITPQVILTSAEKYSAEFLAQAKRFCSDGETLGVFPAAVQNIPGATLQIVKADALARVCADADVIFDALLGTGQRSAPRGAIGELLSVVNGAVAQSLKRPDIIAVDVPTGIDADTGAAFDPHVAADRTITVEAVKRGLMQSPARDDCGAIEIVKIGIRSDGPCEYQLIDRDTAPYFPLRNRDAHKGDAGRVLVVGGNLAMPGAPILSGFSALRLGSGLVTVTKFAGAAVTRPLELIDLPITLAAGSAGFAEKNLTELEPALRAANVVIFGPGIGREKNASDFTRALIDWLVREKKHAVVDADALVNLSSLGNLRLAEHIVITPHPGEASKLLATDTEKIQSDRYAAAHALHEETGAVAVLKGASTIVYGAEGGFVNISGNPWMATAGSGDVLCGVIAALMGQRLPPLEAAKLGVYLHGCAGDAAHASHGGPIVASDITEALPAAVGALIR